MVRQTLYRYIDALVAKMDKRRMEQEKYSDMSFVAMFHDVLDCEATACDDPFAVTKKNLCCFLETLKEKGYDFISIDELIAMRREAALRKKIVITFDDGFESLHTIVDPLFRAWKIPYAVFMTTGFLDQPGFLSRSQLKELSENEMCTIGMHADQHVLYRYKPDAYLKENYTRCKDVIADITGVIPSHFAFPYGSVYACSGHNCRIVKRMGAKTVFVTRQLKVRNQDLESCCSIPRLNVPGYYNDTIPPRYRGFDI